MRYNANGNLLVVDDTGYGLFDAAGYTRVTVVDGTTWTGLYASDGSINVVFVPASDPNTGVYHACGGLRVSEDDGTKGLYAASGAIYIEGIDAGGGGDFRWLMEDGTSLVLLENDTDYVLLENG